MFEAAPDPHTLKLAIAGLAATAACLFLVLDFRRRRTARLALDWPLAPGVVVSSRTARRWGFGNGLWMAGLWYAPDIVYRYDVGDTKYTGRGVFLSDTGFARLKKAREVIDRYPRTAEVAVHYNPRRPRQSCLEPVYRDHRTIGIAILLLVIAGGALLA